MKPLNLISAGIESLQDKDFNTKFVTVGQFEMDQLIHVYNRIIDELRKERIYKQEQHYFLDKLIEASPSGIIVLDLDEKITSMNPSAEKMLGSKLVGKALNEIKGTIAETLKKLNKNASEIVKLNGIKTYKCHKSHFLDKGFHHYFILIEELTEEIIKTEKKSYEKLIRMMSHEVNNSTGAINSILNTALSFKEQLGNDKDDYQNALQVAIERNARLSEFMSDFAKVVRIPAPMKETVDLHKIVESVHSLMNYEREKRKIEWIWEIEDHPLTIKADVQQMEHVLVNIIKNAIEAIEDNGTITIITETSPKKRLIIRDNGKGIPANIQQQLFAPFFSTKKNGQGIGLTLIREILMNHEFQFSLASRGRGFTEFLIEF